MQVAVPSDTQQPSIALHAQDLVEASGAGLLTEQQGQALWTWLVQREAQHTAKPVGIQTQGYANGPTFGFVNVLYYLGGMVAIGAMSLFMTLGFQSMGAGGLLVIAVAYFLGCLKVADHFKARGLRVPASNLAALAVVLVPLTVWCVQSLLGLWPPGGSDLFSDYHRLVDWRYTTLELATLAAGVAMLWRYRLPFMVMPIAVTVWYMSMDVANALMQHHGFDWTFTRNMSVVFGIGTIALAMWVDIRCRRAATAAWRQDFAFWLYQFGAIMFWGGLSLNDASNEIGKFLYALLNVALVLGGAALGRRVFTVLGAIGLALYLGHLSHQVFRDSMLFPFALTLLGLGVVGLGVWWQRHEEAIHAHCVRYLPAGLRHPLRPSR